MMEQLSEEEVDHGVEEDSDHEDTDLEKMFGDWLGELDTLTKGLASEKKPAAPSRKSESNLASFRYRFSMHNLHEALNEGEEVDLDALMADLCSMGQELESITNISAVLPTAATEMPPKKDPPSLRDGPSETELSLEELTAQLEQASFSIEEAAAAVASQPSIATPTVPTPTPSDTNTGDGSPGSASSRSSVVSKSSSQDSDRLSRSRDSDLSSSTPVNEHPYLDRKTSVLVRNMAGKPTHLLTQEEQEAKLKAEKIKMALEKIKEAQIKKLVVRVHMTDSSSKTVMVDERQTVRQVLDGLVEKSHSDCSPDWSLVETIPELRLERFFEDHENLVENLLNWTRDSPNKLLFVPKKEKYALFKNPQNYLLGAKEAKEMPDRNKETLLEECFCGSTVTVPELEGLLFLKEDGKKSWKKRHFVLRASGIYYVPKGKTKTLRDLACFIQFEHVSVYYGQDFRIKHKAPTDYCFVLKHPQIQKKSQYIKYLCCEDARSLQQWVTGIRIAKYGKKFYDNYQEAARKAEVASDWSSLSSSSMKSASSSGSLPESHSVQSGQSDSGVSDVQPSSHARSQSIVSTMFSEAWKRGTQIEEQNKEKHVRADGEVKTPALQCSIQSRPQSGWEAIPPPPPPLPPSFAKHAQNPPPPPPLPAAWLSPQKLTVHSAPASPAHRISHSSMEASSVGPVPSSPSIPKTPWNKVTTPAIPPHPLPPPLLQSKKGSTLPSSSQQPSVGPNLHLKLPVSHPIPPPPPPKSPSITQPLAKSFGKQQLSQNPTTVSVSPLSSPMKMSPPTSLANQDLPLPLPPPPPTPPANSSPPSKLPKPHFPMGNGFPPVVAGSQTPFPGLAGHPKSPQCIQSLRGCKKPPPLPQRQTSVKGLDDIISSQESTQKKLGKVISVGKCSGPPLPPAKPEPRPVFFPNSVSHNTDLPFPPPPSNDLDFPPPPPPEDLACFPPPPPPPPLSLECYVVPLPTPPKLSSAYPGMIPNSPSRIHDVLITPPPTPPKPSSKTPTPFGSPAATANKKPAPPILPKRSDSTRLTNRETPCSPGRNQAPDMTPLSPTRPGSELSQANFLADLNRTLQRKSFKHHGPRQPHATLDDMALPPPPPELLSDSHYSSTQTSVSKYATLRRGPPPAPPKRDLNTRLTYD
uniref:Ras association (RalGDS/AF-6) and pleckstrin homology domains 1 n=1 Tax=Eptatretus burgeri TaxID=7764 RepID=A0A8C4QUR0_EPTBU